VDYGEEHFSSGEYPLMYFTVLCLTQQFEKAVEYAVKQREYFPAGVHFAVVLDHYGLLSLSPDPLGELLPEHPDYGTQLNLLRVVNEYCHALHCTCALTPPSRRQHAAILHGLTPRYTHRFLSSHAEDAFHYFLVLRETLQEGFNQEVHKPAPPHPHHLTHTRDIRRTAANRTHRVLSPSRWRS
jgi:hypothetical protein